MMQTNSRNLKDSEASRAKKVRLDVPTKSLVNMSWLERNTEGARVKLGAPRYFLSDKEAAHLSVKVSK